ncbi:DUF3180 domain-containing protein [Candidatus Frankia nodulisporulans]|uniref:DUF3180 domain-containing protein n=1 Tax=Candidatus Frankia nodulisporulans TaxID=2060052 RepID=UPI0013D3961D|nr:DUF3180 domain-containing protein [Candidatus Frankia nodulisporulans]
MNPTRGRDLALVAVIFGALAYLLLWWAYRSIPALPRTAPVSVLVIGALELQIAGHTRRRLEGRPGTRPIVALTVARLAAFAKASSVAAAALAGGWAGTLGYTIPRTDEFGSAGGDAITAGLGLAAAVVLLVGGLVLERVCRVRRE